MPIWRTKAEGPPSQWKPTLYANVGTEQLFVYRFADEIPRLLQASLFDPERKAADEAITRTLLEGFVPAFEHLKKIRDNNPTPELNRLQAYDNFMSTLWQAYKTLLPKAALAMGFDIGFLYEKDSKFETGAAAFASKYPDVNSELIPYLRAQRNAWHNKLAEVRNSFIEHRNLSRQDVKEFYCVEQAERFFESAWTTAEDILVCLIESRFMSQFILMEIPLAERDKEKPDRFQIVLHPSVKLPPKAPKP